MCIQNSPRNSLTSFSHFSEVTYGKPIVEVCGNSTYFVNFPKGEDSSVKDSILVSDERIENKLAEQFAQSLHVKRKRQDSSTLLLSYREDDQVGEVDTGKKRMKVEQIIGDSRMRNIHYKAEEVGQIMPHLSHESHKLELSRFGDCLDSSRTQGPVPKGQADHIVPHGDKSKASESRGISKKAPF